MSTLKFLTRNSQRLCFHAQETVHFPSSCIKVPFGGTDVDCSILGSSTGGNFKILPSSSTERIHESAASEKGGQRPPWGLRIGQQLLLGFQGQPTMSVGTEHQPSISQWWPPWPMHWGSPAWFRKRVWHQSNLPNQQKNKIFLFKFLAISCSIWELSSQSMDQTHTPCTRSVES